MLRVRRKSAVTTTIVPPQLVIETFTRSPAKRRKQAVENRVAGHLKRDADPSGVGMRAIDDRLAEQFAAVARPEMLGVEAVGVDQMPGTIRMEVQEAGPRRKSAGSAPAKNGKGKSGRGPLKKNRWPCRSTAG